MKTKLINRFYLLLTAVVFVCLASCSSKPKHARLISKDAFVVANLNVEQIADKAQSGNAKNVADKLKKEVEKMDFSAEAKAKLLKIVEDPAEAGVDLRKPLLFFVEDPEKSTGGMVAALHDADKLTELLNAMAKEENVDPVKETDGLFVLRPGGERSEVGVVYDKDMLLILGGNDADMVTEAQRRFKDEKDEGILARADFEEFCKAKGDAQLLVWGDLLNKIEDRDLDEMKRLIPANVNPADYSLLLDLNSEKGAVVLSAQTLALTDAAKQYAEEQAKMAGKIDAELLNYVSEKALFMFAANLKGEEVAKQLLPIVKKQEYANATQVNLVETILKHINGNVVVACNSVSEKTPEVCVLVKVDDEKKVQEAVKTLGGSMLEEVEPGQFSVMGMSYLGVKDGILYVSMPHPVLSMAKPKQTIDEGAMKGNYFYCVLNMQGLLQNEFVKMQMERDRDFRMMKPALEKCKSLEFVGVEAGKCELRLKMTDESKNPLEILVSMI